MSNLMASLLSLLLLFGFSVVLIIILSLLRKPRREYGEKSVTLKGEEVRSIAQKEIADYFVRNNINYVYEQEARTKELLNRDTIGHPDFYLPDYDVHVEYWGLVDADDRSTRKEYVQNMKRKIAVYYENNIKFISLYPRNLENLDWIFRKKFKKVTGLELP